MCGIAGFFLKDEALAPSVLEAMTLALAHRGPDDQGFYGVALGNAERNWKEPGHSAPLLQLGLGFRRLSILDLSSAGAQPMHSEDSRYWVAFNGQIYNYIELKKELGGTWRSQCDTEVLIRAFEKWGPGALDRFNGMFAFAMYDKKERLLTVARDPLGIKPLYYFQDDRGVFFASEIRALLKARVSSPSLRVPLLGRYLMANWVPDPDTLFEGIYKLEPGHFFTVGVEGRLHKKRYWDLNFHPNNALSLKDWTEQLDATLHGAVTRQLRSDVPVGFFLSGGVDSSLLAAKAVQVNSEKPATFTTGFRWKNSTADTLDVQSARIMRDKFGFDHTEIILEPSILDVLPHVVESMEEPVADPAAINSYLICKAAASRFKVLISGQGGDELFGGYPVYRSGWAAARLQRLPGSAQSIAGALSRWSPKGLSGKALHQFQRGQKFLQSAQQPWPEPFFQLRSAMKGNALATLLTPETLSRQYPPFARHQEHHDRTRGWDPLQQMLYLDTKTYMVATNLTYSDKTSMASSVELRVPLLDMELVRLVQKVPSRYKMNLKESKILLKAVASRYLPPSIVNRKKSGFGLPLKEWFRSDLGPLASDLLSESHLRKQGLLSPTLPGQWMKEHREGKADHSMRLYSLLCFEMWCERFGL